MCTKFLTKEEAEKNLKWVIVDAADKPVGRVASQVAAILRGKTKPTFSPHVACGDGVIVINAEKVKFTGNKWTQKKYYDYSGYIGGLRARTAEEMLKTYPGQILERAIEGMLPAGPLGSKLISRLRVYVGDTHKQSSQAPVAQEVRI